MFLWIYNSQEWFIHTLLYVYRNQNNSLILQKFLTITMLSKFQTLCLQNNLHVCLFKWLNCFFNFPIKKKRVKIWQHLSSLNMSKQENFIWKILNVLNSSRVFENRQKLWIGNKFSPKQCLLYVCTGIFDKILVS